VTPSGADSVAASLQAALPPSSDREGALQVSVRPWGHVYVDGEHWLTQVSHARQFTLPAGDHVVVAEHPDLGRREHHVTVSPGQTARFDADLRPADVTVTALDSTGAPFRGPQRRPPRRPRDGRAPERVAPAGQGVRGRSVSARMLIRPLPPGGEGRVRRAAHSRLPPHPSRREGKGKGKYHP
jgi:hypothetical protein